MPNLSEDFFAAILVGLEVAGKSFEVTEKVASRVPGLTAAFGFVLDIVFGPEDEHEYVSTTSPSSPPPPHPQQ